ncbi:myosin light chain kinase 2, skeletal/cardiac muscle [Pterocles gutturalis]
MEQGGGAGSTAAAGGAGGLAPPEAGGSTAQPVPVAPQPQAGTVPAATEAQDGGKDEPGREKAPDGATAPDGGQEVSAGGTAPQPWDGGMAAPTEEGASAVQHKVSAEVMEDGGKGQKDAPGMEKAPAAGEPGGGQAAPAQGTAPVVAPVAAQAQDGGKDEPREVQAPGGLEAKDGGEAKPAEERAAAAAEAGGGKAKPAEETASAAAQGQDGGNGEPVKEKTTAAAKEKSMGVAKEKVPAAAKAQDGGKKTAKAEKTPADKKPAKEKAPAAVKAQDGDHRAAKAEKAPAAKKAQNGGKEEPAKEKALAPAKEKAPAPAKAQDGEKTEAKAGETPAPKKPQDGSKEDAGKEKAPAAAKVQDGGKKGVKVEKPPGAPKAEEGGREEPAKEKPAAAAGEKVPAAAEEATAAVVKAQDGGKEGAKVGPPPAEAGDGGKEPAVVTEARGEGDKAAKATVEQPPRGPEPPRPALRQSLSCPAACPREEQPEVAAMETIPEETPTMETILEETPVMEPSEEPPSPGGHPLETEPPPSPYLTQDFGKEDAFEILDDVPPPPAPFAHRIVTLRTASVSSLYNLSSKEILGGGKFGEVHTCTEKQTGLKLAAKVIRKQGSKDKEMVLLEIDVMNQLNHRNLIQLYDAIETPREIILFMEFVEGGELFERIVDDDYHLTEVDCMVFVRQICEGIRFMHHMRVLHLDLKPENILCVAATGHMVKIIDFGLARRYNPQEKLKVNFGTPEFLSPEVVNYEQVSYATDMWSMGVITYMLLSGLSPFLGDNDTETLNNVLAANWYFDEETFESVSEEAKDFVSNLIIKEKSARLSAGQCLQHPWLNNLAEKAKRCNRRLKSQVLLKKYVMRRRWKKNFIGVCAANRFRKITSSGSLTALGV